MFWPFTKWTSSPPPWGPSQWNAPVQLRDGSFMQARSHMTPKYADRFAAYLSTPAPRYMVSPSRAYGAISKHPGDAFQVVADAHAQLRGLADQALSKHVQGLPLSMDEGRALIDVYLPPVVHPQERCGPGVVPSWDVPPCDRSTIPQAVQDQRAHLQNPAEAARQLAVGAEIAQITAIRNGWLQQTGMPMRGRR